MSRVLKKGNGGSLLGFTYGICGETPKISYEGRGFLTAAHVAFKPPPFGEEACYCEVKVKRDLFLPIDVMTHKTDLQLKLGHFEPQ